MASTPLPGRREIGPASYEHWRAVEEGSPTPDAYEVSLFTDAVITGEVTTDLGPYKLLNAGADERQCGRLRPRVVLRVEWSFSPDVETPVGLGSDTPDRQSTDAVRYHGGGLHDEIAALVSVCLGVRLKPGAMTRMFQQGGDPRGQPFHWTEEDPVLPLGSVYRRLVPGAVGPASLIDAARLSDLPLLSPRDAVAVVIAARQYQEALWIAEAEPERSWLMLASAVETAAVHWRSAAGDPVDRLKAWKPELYTLLARSRISGFVAKVAELIDGCFGSTKKFIDFVMEFLPDPPKERPPQEFLRHDWTKKQMSESLRTIYNLRSKALHTGIPFPPPLCAFVVQVEGQKVPAEVPFASSYGVGSSTWLKKDLPMTLYTFEYITRAALLKWWTSMVPRTRSE